MLTVKDVTKRYGKFTVLEHVSLEFQPGVYGLLAPNGAGKTTLMKMLTTLAFPTEGEILWSGTEIRGLGAAYRQQLGYLPQQLGFYPHYTPNQYLSYLSALKGLDGKTAGERIPKLLDLVGLSEVADKKMKKLSGGMVQRVGIAQALLGDPAFLIFDEPTVGLDPEERIHFRNLFSQKAQDRLVLLSTHIIEDVQSVCGQLVVMNHGSILFTGTPEQLIQAAEGHVGVFWEREAGQEQGLHITARVNTSQGVRCRAVADALPAYVQRSEPSLEDAYLYLISREAVQ